MHQYLLLARQVLQRWTSHFLWQRDWLFGGYKGRKRRVLMLANAPSMTSNGLWGMEVLKLRGE